MSLGSTTPSLKAACEIDDRKIIPCMIGVRAVRSGEVLFCPKEQEDCMGWNLFGVYCTGPQNYQYIYVYVYTGPCDYKILRIHLPMLPVITWECILRHIPTGSKALRSEPLQTRTGALWPS